MESSQLLYTESDKSFESQLHKKISIRIVPFLFMMYLLAFLDRANLANVKLFIVNTTTNSTEPPGCNTTSSGHCTPGFITEKEYGMAVGVFYIGYVLFAIPSNLILKRTGAPKWLGFITLVWGTLTICTFFVKTAVELIIVRFFLGLAESGNDTQSTIFMPSGFFPGIMYYLSLWFPPKRLAYSIGLIYFASPVAGVLSGILSYGVLHMDGVHGLAGWQWLFIIEGVPSVIAGTVCWFWLPEQPATSKFLSAPESIFLSKSLKYHAKQEVKQQEVEFLSIFLDWRVWMFCLMSLCPYFIASIVSFFIPAFINNFGVTPLTSNLLSAVPFFVGGIFLAVNSYHSDLTQERPLHLLVPFGVHVLGWAVLAIFMYFDLHLYARYALLTFTVGLTFTWTPIFNAWLMETVPGGTFLAVATAFATAFGNLAQICAPYVTALITSHFGSYMWVAVLVAIFGVFTIIIGVALYLLLVCKEKIDPPKPTLEMRNTVASEVDEVEIS
jgi:MFS family permease